MKLKTVTTSDLLRSIRGGPALLTERQVAQILGYTNSVSLANRRKGGRLAEDGLPFTRTQTGRIRYKRGDLLRYLARRKNGAQ